MHINPHKIRTVSGSFLQAAAPTIVGLVIQNLVGFKSDLLQQMIDIQLSKLVLVERGQTLKLHTESENKAGKIHISIHQH